MDLRKDCDTVIAEAIASVMPDAAVVRALGDRTFEGGRLILISVGKAAWSMAKAAYDCLERKPDRGVVITKYGHSLGTIGDLEIYEAGHPVPDGSTFAATRRALQLTEGLTRDDHVLFLLSGGGSALFELPLVQEETLTSISSQLLSSGADIVEINTVRKRLSSVKGGRFALHCAPARIFSVVLSDIIGDPLDMIASGPAYPDSSTCEDAMRVTERCGIEVSGRTLELLQTETPKALNNTETLVTGSVRQLCAAAQSACRALGYDTVLLTDCLDCQARHAGEFIASIARTHQNTDRSLAFVLGGETVVKVTGKGMGGRNQELALSAAAGIAGLRDTAVFSVGSDGTDGPTDAAGGYVDGSTAEKLSADGISIESVLNDNDSYHALQKCGGLIVTGPTGTNVNDLTVLLIKR